MSSKGKRKQVVPPGASSHRSGDDESKIESTATVIAQNHTPEVIFALCGPIGAPLHQVAQVLNTLMGEEFGYQCSIITLSDFIKERLPHSEPLQASGYARTERLISEGNLLRKNHGSSVLVDLAIVRISGDREKDRNRSGSKGYGPLRKCYVVDSIKNTSELDALRAVYGDMLYCVGVYAPKDARERVLVKEMETSDVHKLIDRDSGEELDHGQRVRHTFPLADYFLHADGELPQVIETRLRRFLRLLFGVGVITPTISETAMFQAASAARNSGCLSRQVGAAIVDRGGRPISVGWNDVPKFGGGVYQCPVADDQSDKRCANWRDRRCANEIQREEVAKNATEKLIEEGLVERGNEKKAIAAILDSRVGDLIEFSRAMHAEMHAIISAQAAGGSLHGSSLFCTTYPCHLCACQIIGAGISEVFYIEPYRKSLSVELHADAASEAETASGVVRILPYDGVAPRKYWELFAIGSLDRKLNGRAVVRPARDANPKHGVSLESIPALESFVLHRLRGAGIRKVPGVSESADETLGSEKASRTSNNSRH